MSAKTNLPKEREKNPPFCKGGYGNKRRNVAAFAKTWSLSIVFALTSEQGYVTDSTLFLQYPQIQIVLNGNQELTTAPKNSVLIISLKFYK